CPRCRGIHAHDRVESMPIIRGIRSADDIADRSFRQICLVQGLPYNAGVEREFWVAIAAVEELLTLKNGRRTRASRTHTKVGKVGVLKTIEDWALAKGPTTGFRQLVESGMHDLTGEAIVLRHPEQFSVAAVAAARQRLAAFWHQRC
ncbi:hypothetical protein ACFONL_11340, partial [Camelimonas fluminis]